MGRATWTWTFDLPPAELWPVLADTNRFNEAMGLPPYVLEETPQPNGTVLRRGKGKAAGFALEWEEKPYEWIEGRHFRRDYSSGYDVGRKAAAQNLSDVVAMGARPTGLLVGLAAPGDLPVAWALQLADGLRDECAEVGAVICATTPTLAPADRETGSRLVA